MNQDQQMLVAWIEDNIPTEVFADYLFENQEPRYIYAKQYVLRFESYWLWLDLFRESNYGYAGHYYELRTATDITNTLNKIKEDAKYHWNYHERT